jgi:hypothetical protein
MSANDREFSQISWVHYSCRFADIRGRSRCESCPYFTASALQIFEIIKKAALAHAAKLDLGLRRVGDAGVNTARD